MLPVRLEEMLVELDTEERRREKDIMTACDSTPEDVGEFYVLG